MEAVGILTEATVTTTVAMGTLHSGFYDGGYYNDYAYDYEAECYRLRHVRTTRASGADPQKIDLFKRSSRRCC